MIRPAAVRSLRGKTLRPTETRKISTTNRALRRPDLPRPAPTAIKSAYTPHNPSVVSESALAVRVPGMAGHSERC